MRRRERNDSGGQENGKNRRESVKRVAPRILKLARPHIRALIIGFAALALGSGINLLFPFLIRKVLNQEYGFVLERDLLWITLALITLFAIQCLFFYVRHYAFQAVGYRVVSEFREALYRAMLSQDISFFDASRVGDLLSRLTSDTQVVQRAVTINISVAIRYTLQVLGGVALMLWISPRLTLMMILIIPFLMLSSMVWGKRLRTLSRKMQDELGEANVIAEETIGSIRTVRSFAGDDYETKRYSAAISRALVQGIERTKVAAAFSSVMVFLLNSAIALVIYYGGELVLSERLTLGDLTGFLLYCVMVAVSFGFLVGVWDEFLQAVGAAERIFEIIDSTPKVVTSSNPHSLNSTEGAGVRFENVQFAYPSRIELPALRDVSLDIPYGKTVALVGPSGAGKSTIASLIPRFYDPQAGVIRFGGVDIRELDLSQLRERISVVQQQPQVFSISIGENIRYGRLSATDEEVREAAKAANIHDFIATLPKGYDTLVGDRGVHLSGGEKQRIAIARALLKNSEFLILDEATSALDSENEALVQLALNRLMENRTTLIIAHRLSTIQDADIVFVLKDGRVSQSGSHQQLMAEPGLYKTLVEHQLLA